MTYRNPALRRMRRQPVDAGWYLLPAALISLAVSAVLLWPSSQAPTEIAAAPAIAAWPSDAHGPDVEPWPAPATRAGDDAALEGIERALAY